MQRDGDRDFSGNAADQELAELERVEKGLLDQAGATVESEAPVSGADGEQRMGRQALLNSILGDLSSGPTPHPGLGNMRPTPHDHPELKKGGETGMPSDIPEDGHEYLCPVHNLLVTGDTCPGNGKPHKIDGRFAVPQTESVRKSYGGKEMQEKIEKGGWRGRMDIIKGDLNRAPVRAPKSLPVKTEGEDAADNSGAVEKSGEKLKDLQDAQEKQRDQINQTVRVTPNEVDQIRAEMRKQVKDAAARITREALKLKDVLGEVGTAEVVTKAGELASVMMSALDRVMWLNKDSIIYAIEFGKGLARIEQQAITLEKAVQEITLEKSAASETSAGKDETITEKTPRKGKKGETKSE
jgi:hypothetical protein